MSAKSDQKTVRQALVEGTPTLVGVMLGACLGGIISIVSGQCAQQRADAAAERLHRRDLREGSYARLMGLKFTWAQAQRTYMETWLLAEIARARALHVSHSPEDLKQANSLGETANSMLPKIADLRKQAFETLAEISLSYSVDKPFRARFTAIFDISPEIYRPDQRGIAIKTEGDLERWHSEARQQIVATIATSVLKPTDDLLAILEGQVAKLTPLPTP